VKWTLPSGSPSTPAKRVYWRTFQNEYDPLVQGLASQWSTVARPFHLAVMPGRTGSSWARNCLARVAGETEPKLARPCRRCS
jgi:hypothetical protein